MTTLRPSLAKLLASSRYWVPLADGDYLATPMLTIQGQGFGVQRDELIDRHLHLPRIIDDLCEPMRNFVTQSRANAELVFETLRTIENRVISLKNANGDLLYFATVSSVSQHADKPDLVTLVGRALSYKDWKEYGPTLACVSKVDVEMHYVQHEQLDVQFPGWQERWAAGQTLGLKNYALTKYIFWQTAAVPDLPTDLVFDGAY